MKGLDKLRPARSQGALEPQTQRRFIAGKDHSVHRHVDILAGLSDADIAQFVRGLTPSQEQFILQYCRRIANDISPGPGRLRQDLHQGHPSNRQEARKESGLSYESNSAGDNIVEGIADNKKSIVVRLHSLGKYPGEMWYALAKLTHTQDLSGVAF